MPGEPVRDVCIHMSAAMEPECQAISSEDVKARGRRGMDHDADGMGQCLTDPDAPAAGNLFGAVLPDVCGPFLSGGDGLQARGARRCARRSSHHVVWTAGLEDVLPAPCWAEDAREEP